MFPNFGRDSIRIHYNQQVQLNFRLRPQKLQLREHGHHILHEDQLSSTVSIRWFQASSRHFGMSNNIIWVWTCGPYGFRYVASPSLLVDADIQR